MNKNIKALLCATALLGSMSTLSVKAEDIVVNSEDTRSFNNSATNVDGSVTNNGTISINTNGGMVGVTTLDNNSTIINNGTTENQGIVTQTIDNSGNISGGGRLSFGGTSSNSGTITQGIVSITGGTFNNTSSFTATGNFTNAATISGNGTLNINAGGTNNAAITQNNVKIGGTNFTNNATLTTNGTFENSATISGTNGSLDIKNGGTNTGNITQNNITVAGNLSNSKQISSTGTFTNSGNISGSGSLNVSGGSNSTSGVIAQAITTSGTFTNSGNINATVTNTTTGNQTNDGTITGSVTNSGTYTNNGTISGDVTNQGSQFTNTNTITGNVTNTSGTFTNSGNIGAEEAGVNITNSATFENTTGSIIANTIQNNNGTFTNNNTLTAAIFNNSATVDGTGTANLGGGTNSGSYTQDNINLTGNYTNNSTMTANKDFSNTSSSLNGTGSLIVNDTTGNSSNGGTISQKDVSLSGTKFTNNGSITTATNGTFINHTTVEGTGSLTIQNGGSSNKAITQNDITIAGAFTNDAKMTSTNNFQNSGNITGSGSLEVKAGSNSGLIAQAIINTGAYTNNGTISGEVTNNGTYTNNGTISGAIESDGTGFTNNKTITGDITNTSGTFTNSATGKIGDDTHKVNITNSDKFVNNNSVIANEITNTDANAVIENNKQISVENLNNSQTIQGNNGELIVKDGSNSGSITQKSLTTNGTFENTSDINAAVTNNGTFTNDSNGTITKEITNTNSFTNSGSIGTVDNAVNITNSGADATFTNNSNSVVANVITNKNGATFTNNNTFTVNDLQNSATVDGTGKLTINSGTNTGSIKQDSLTFDGTYDNQKDIEAEVVNEGNFTNNTNGSILGKITNSNIFKNKGNIGAEGSAADIINDGTFTNESGSNIIASAIENKTDKNFTNNSTITADSFTNDGTVNGAGSMDIGQLTNKSNQTFEQSTLHLTGASTNDGTITINNEFTNNSSLTGSGNLYITDTTRNSGNTGSIEQAIVSIAGTKYTNDGSITTTGAFTNSANELVNNDTITAGGTFKNTGKISGTNGTLNINAGGSSTGEIVQKEVNVSDKFSNNAKLQAGTLTNNGEITNTSNIIADTIQNNNKITGGNIEIGGGLNNGTIDVAIAKVTGDLTNSDSFTATNFTNDGNISGTGNLTITNGTNNGTITAQTSLTVKTLLTNNNSIEVGSINNEGRIDLTGDASLKATAQTNPLTGWIKSLGSGKTNTVAVNGDIAGKLSAEGGSTLALTQGNVVEDAVVEVSSGNTLDLKGSSTTVINNNDTWTGTITTNGGSLTVKDRTSNGALIANTGALTLETGNLDITSGSVIKDAVTTVIKENTTLNILNGGQVTLNAGDSWENGAVIALGEAGTPAAVKDANELQGILDDIKSGKDVPAGLTMLDVKGLDSTGTLKANNGLLLLGDKNLDIQGESYIATAVAMELQGNINVSNGGVVSIDNNDIMSGTEPTVTLSDGGTLNYGRTEDAGLKIVADAGNLNLLGGSNLTFNAGNIADAVAIDIQKDATLRLDGSTLNLDSLDQWNGNIINENGIINANGLTKSSSTATLTQANGELNLYNNTNLTLGSESLITGGEINITKDKGDVTGSAGSRLTIYSGSDEDSQVIQGGDMTIDKDSSFVVASGTFNLDSLKAYGEMDENGVIQAALINTMNGERNTSSIGTLSSDSIANFNIDIHARSNQNNSNDQFIIGSMGDGTIRIDQWALNGDIFGWDAPIDRNITLGNIFMDEDGNAILNGNIAVTDQETFTPIGWYKLNKNDVYEDIIEDGVVTGRRLAGSNYSLNLTKFNPQVFRGQVATVAQWMNQLAIDDMLFNHTMLIPSFKEEKGNKPSKAMANQYSAINPLFSPYQYSVKDGGLWYKMYGTFEHLNMNNGLGRVGNNAYGALIGADFGLKELKNGWKFMPTAYVGYNGAHQYWAGMGQYQNGGQAGFMGTWYKDNFIVSSLTYGGIYDNSMDVHGHNENTFNYFAGTAAKAAYNWRFHKDWVLQPNLMAAYNYFGQQNWHTDFGQMGMMAGMLHGVNIAPGVNLIWEKETFSTYLTLQYMYNINGASGGRAGNVGLPQVEMDRGYIQYGIGFTKKFTDRASGYLQAVLRNVGRTGVGFQAGFNFQIGK